MGLIGTGVCLLVAAWLALQANAQARLRAQADTAARAGRWDEALTLWRQVNQNPGWSSGASYRAEARACLALGRAGQAESALARASTLDPRHPEPWLMRLEIARMEDRPLDALDLADLAWRTVPQSARRSLLQSLTLALLAGAPEDLARETLGRWVAADKGDLDAVSALDRLRSLNPESEDPPLAERIEKLDALLTEHPEHTGIREALLLALAEAGEFQRGQAVLDAWPETERDARFNRLAGRWDHDSRNDPSSAVGHFREALHRLPFDWKTRYRLARALQAAGETDAAKRTAVEVSRLRERLDPARLGGKLEQAMRHLEDPANRLSLAELCESVGLERLAAAWKLEAESQPDPAAPIDELGTPGAGSRVEPLFNMPTSGPPSRRR